MCKSSWFGTSFSTSYTSGDVWGVCGRTKLKNKHICVRQVEQLCLHGLLTIFSVHSSVPGAQLCVCVRVYVCTPVCLFFPDAFFSVLLWVFIKKWSYTEWTTACVVYWRHEKSWVPEHKNILVMWRAGKETWQLGQFDHLFIILCERKCCCSLYTYNCVKVKRR